MGSAEIKKQIELLRLNPPKTIAGLISQKLMITKQVCRI